MIYTVGQMLPFIGRKLDGSGVDSTCEPGTSRCIAALNRATRMLMVESPTSVDAYMQVPVSANGIITLDRSIKTIRSAKLPGRDQMNVVGPSFRFLDGTSYAQVDGIDCGLEQLEFMGNQYAVNRDPDIPRLLFAVSDRPDDAGVSVTVIGMDEQGKELRNGGVKGIQLPVVFATCATAPVLSCSDGYSSGKVSSVSLVSKPVTKGYVQIWGLDQPTGSVFWLTTLAPDETTPNLTRYRLSGAQGSTSIYCYVLLQFCERFDLNDISLIQQPDALEYMTQAIACLDRQDYGNYQLYRNAATAWINKDQRTSHGTDHRLNVRVSKMPLGGRSYPMRGMYPNDRRRR